MRVTLEQVEALRKRIHCDYQTAERALRKSKGNMDDAILYLKKREGKKYKKVFVIIQEIISKLFSFNLLVFKEDKKVFNFPIILVVLIVWSLNIPLPIILSIGVLAALSEFSFELMDRNESNEKMDENFSVNQKPNQTRDKSEDKKEEKPINTTNTVPTEVRPPTLEKAVDEQDYDDDDEDGFNEIIIE